VPLFGERGGGTVDGSLDNSDWNDVVVAPHFWAKGYFHNLGLGEKLEGALVAPVHCATLPG